MKHILLPYLALCLLLLVSPEVGRASGTITNCTESDLRVALRGGGSVILACDSTITLTSPLVIGKETVLDGTGHTPVITGSFSSTNASGLFYVQPGARLTLRNLTVSGASLTMTNSANGLDGLAAYGAALFINRAVVTLEGCTFSDHTVAGGDGSDAVEAGETGADGGHGAGAAVYNSGGQLVVTNCVFSNNSATGGTGGAGGAGRGNGNGGSGGDGGNGGSGFGAAIFNTSSGLLSVFASTFSSNQVMGNSGGLGALEVGVLGSNGKPGASGNGLGAAVYSDSGQVTIVNSTFVGNHALGASGSAGTAGNGALRPGEGAPGGVTVGGGLCAFGGAVALTNCTFVENALNGGPGGTGGTGSTFGFGSDGGKGGKGGDAAGAGLYTAPGANVIVVNNTFTDNRVAGGAGGVGGPGSGVGRQGGTGSPGNQAGAALANAGGILQVRNSILANSQLGGNAGGQLIDQGFNISSDASANLTAEGSRNQLDPLLGSFTTAGGLVPTITLSSNSPAINAIIASGNNGAPSFDQRGALRLAPFDIGAFESDGSFLAPALQIQFLSKQVVLSWPATGTFLLQTSTKLPATNQWATVLNQPTLIGGLHSVSLPPTNRASFYRLANP